ncbi:MAG: hypothetical protein ACP5D7_07810 [Limnospira sp.]
MTELNSPSSDRKWIEQVNDLLIQVARASLADIPTLPTAVSTSALPLARQAQAIQNQVVASPATGTHWQGTHQDWIEQVRQFLLELSRIALSDRPKLPENIAHRALSLAETAQDIQEALENGDEGSDALGASHERKGTDVNTRFEQLREQLKAEWGNSADAGNPGWQQVLTLLDVAQTQYNDLHAGPPA